MRVATEPMHGWLATPTRRNALKGIFIAPALLMLGVAVQSKPNYIDFDNMISSQEAEVRITNYVPVVREAEEALRYRPRDPQRIRQAAAFWISKAEEGKLKPMPQLGPDDAIHAGVKSQILNAARELSRRLCISGEEEMKAGRYEAAARDFATGLEVLQPLRYSDLSSVAIVGNAQRKLLNRLNESWKHLPALVKEDLKPTLKLVEQDDKSLEVLLKNEKRIAVIVQAKAYEMSEATGEEVPVMIDIEKELGLLSRLAQNTERNSNKLLSNMN